MSGPIPSSHFRVRGATPSSGPTMLTHKRGKGLAEAVGGMPRRQGTGLSSIKPPTGGKAPETGTNDETPALYRLATMLSMHRKQLKGQPNGVPSGRRMV